MKDPSGKRTLFDLPRRMRNWRLILVLEDGLNYSKYRSSEAQMVRILWSAEIHVTKNLKCELNFTDIELGT